MVGWCGNDYGTAHIFRAENMINELFDLTATLTNERNDNHFGFGVASHHAQEHGLANTTASKKTNTLATADAE